MQAQKKMKKHADMHRTPRVFQVGDMVYLKVKPHRETALVRATLPSFPLASMGLSG
jgi:hypothetical protein